jgi:membrane protease YdiL (CAAX protease family)
MDSDSEDVPPAAMEPPAMDPHETAPQNLQDTPLPPPAPRLRAGISDDLRVPWGWLEVALFAILGVIGSVVITWGMAQVAVRFLGANSNEVFGETITTAKSVVVLLSQAMLDGFAILYLYLMLAARTAAPFWPSIGWREMRTGSGKIRDSALLFLACGAALALVVSFVGGFLNSKTTLPIEELLKARVSILLFGILGVLVVAAGVAITGTLFGLMHAAQLWGGWGQIALLILVGVVLTWVRARTGTVAASYFVHLGYNGLQLVGYLIYVVSGVHH